MAKKHEVLTTFRDKLTGDIVIAGSFFGANDNKRLEDMFNRGLIKEDEATAPIKKANTSKKSGE